MMMTMIQICVRMTLMLVLMLPMLLLAGQSADAKASVGKVSYAYGDTFVERYGKKTRVRGGQSVQRDDVLSTGRRGRIKLMMADGSKVYVGPGSRIGLQRYATWGKRLTKGSFKFYWGKARFFVSKLLDRKSSFRVKTSTAVIGVRGTEFSVLVAKPQGVDENVVFEDLPAQAVTTVLMEGKVEITAPSGLVHQLTPGNTAEMDADGKVHVRPSRTDDLVMEALGVGPDVVDTVIEMEQLKNPANIGQAEQAELGTVAASVAAGITPSPQTVVPGALPQQGMGSNVTGTSQADGTMQAVPGSNAGATNAMQNLNAPIQAGPQSTFVLP
ncbi:MAG: FecR family protein [Mariprofundaceae bacterium]|nr:FecR family protein [Mariprofundaceae bacterium]